MSGAGEGNAGGVTGAIGVGDVEASVAARCPNQNETTIVTMFVASSFEIFP